LTALLACRPRLASILPLAAKPETLKEDRLMKRITAESSSTKPQQGRQRVSARDLAFTAALLASLWGGVGPLYAGCCEEGKKEVLTSGIYDYTPIGKGLLFGCLLSIASVDNEFHKPLSWARSLDVNTAIWKIDWAGLGGLNLLGVDANDFVYFCGLGVPGGIVLTANPPDNIVHSVETSFGDVDLEWVTLDSSSTLMGQAVRDSWHENAFKGGLHLLMGWHDSRLDGNSGGEFAADLLDGDAFIVAWFDSDGGCIDQPSGTTQIIMSEDAFTILDHVHGKGSIAPDPVFDGPYVSYGHDC
jgi:hypothetical protein